MTVFWIVVVLLILAALLFILPPLLYQASDYKAIAHHSLNIAVYQDQLAELERDLENDVITSEQFEQARLELERRLLEDVPADNGDVLAKGPQKSSKAAAIIVGIAVPAFAVGLYQWLGTPESLSPAAISSVDGAGASMDANPSDMSDQINAMVAQLAQRLKDNPVDPEGWAMLGRSYLVLERLDDAVTAYENAVALASDNPDLLVDYADALAMAGDERSLEGRPLELIQQALALDPDNQKGLWLAGTAAYEKADFEQALEYWRKLYQMLPKDSEDARVMQSNINEAEGLLAGRANIAAGDSPDQDISQDNNQHSQITGVVKLDGKLAKQVNDTDTVFVFARAAAGPRMPLAVIRAQIKDLPLDFSLDDSMAINPAMTISQFPEVIVVARVSKSGNATPQSGDIQGMSDVLRVGKDEAEVVMNEVIP